MTKQFTLRLKTAISLLFSVASFFSVGQNLILNGDCEEPLLNGEIPFWQETLGNDWAQRAAGPEPQNGANYFFPGTAAISELRQLIDISAYSCRIDNGTQTFQFTGYTRAFDQSPVDQSLIIIEFLNSEDSVLSIASFGPFSSIAAWLLADELLTAPAEARKLNVRLRSTRFGGTNNDGYYDNLSLVPVPSEPCPEPTASFSSADSASCAVPFQTNFTDLSSNFPESWIWYFEGAEPDSSTDQNPTGITYTQPGIYDVTLIACNLSGCDTLVMENSIPVFEPAETPTITLVADTMFASGNGIFSWFEHGQPQLVLSTDSFLIPEQAGSYYVLVTDANGCIAQSGAFNYSPDFIPTFKTLGVTVYPNPVSSVVSISVTGGFRFNETVSILNLTGQLLFQKFTNSSSLLLDLSEFPEGIYLVRYTDQGSLQTARLIKAGRIED